MSNRLLTIITPFYNSTDFLETPMNSVLNQTYQNWEYICVDDHSTDGTLEKLREYAAKDPRIKVIAKEKNGGNAISGFNVGIAVAKGEYIQLLGHDDELSPDLLENIAKRIDETQADVIIPDARIVSKNISENIETYDLIGVRSAKKVIDGIKTGDRNVLLSARQAFALSLNWQIHGWACFSIDLIKKVGAISEEMMNGDELWVRMLFLNADQIAFCSGRYVYLRRKESISNKINVKSFDVFRVQQKLLELLKTCKFGKRELKIWKTDTLFKIQYHTYRYVFNKSQLNPDEQKRIEDTLRFAWKMVFRESWADIMFYRTVLKIKHNIRRYKKYLFLKKKLEKKGML